MAGIDGAEVLAQVETVHRAVFAGISPALVIRRWPLKWLVLIRSSVVVART
jgi:hypothetical protein